MIDVKAVAARASALEIQLNTDYPNGVVPITSVPVFNLTEHKAGVTVEAPYGVAARMMSRGTHRLATPDEHNAFREDLKRRTDEYRQRELDKKVASGQIAILQQNGEVRPAAKERK